MGGDFTGNRFKIEDKLHEYNISLPPDETRIDVWNEKTKDSNLQIYESLPPGSHLPWSTRITLNNRLHGTDTERTAGNMVKEGIKYDENVNIVRSEMHIFFSNAHCYQLNVE